MKNIHLTSIMSMTITIRSLLNTKVGQHFFKVFEMILVIDYNSWVRLQNNFLNLSVQIVMKLQCWKNMQFHTFFAETPQKVKKGWRTQNVLTAAVECSFTSINSLIYFWYTKEALCEIEIKAFRYSNHIFKGLQLCDCWNW